MKFDMPLNKENQSIYLIYHALQLLNIQINYVLPRGVQNSKFILTDWFYQLVKKSKLILYQEIRESCSLYSDT